MHVLSAVRQYAGWRVGGGPVEGRNGKRGGISWFIDDYKCIELILKADFEHVSMKLSALETISA